MRTITFTFEGLCGGCGQCCVFEWEGQQLFCENLHLEQPLGTSGASWCGVYADRYANMPIRMVNAEGQVVLDWSAKTVCGLDTIGEALAIMSRGYDQGCSLSTQIIREDDDGHRDGQTRLRYETHPDELRRRWLGEGGR